MTDQNQAEKKICSACGTENEPEYAFCKNCGNSLNQSQNASDSSANTGTNTHAYTNQTAWTNPGQYAYGPYGYQYGDIKISGISADTMSAAIGPNAHKFMPKFMEMELGHKKIGWNWTVFLLGFLLGLPAASCWFFYRKIYKVGAIVLAVGLALTILSTIFIGNILTTLADFYEDYNVQYGISYNDDFEIEIDDDFLVENPEYITRMFKPTIWASLISFVNLAIVIVISLFANGIYRDELIRKITRLNARYPNLDQSQLSRYCGTNTLAAVLAGVAAFIAHVALFSYLFSVFLEMAVNLATY